MRLSKVCVALFFVTLKTCRAEINIAVAKPDEGLAIVEAVVNILTTCYHTYGSQGDAIAVAGNWPENFLPTLWSKKLIPVTLIETSTAQISREKSIRNSTEGYKRRIIVVSVFSVKHLAYIIVRLRYTWWNHMASFIIVLRSPVTMYRCIKVNAYLRVAWGGHIVNAKVICADRSQRRFVYAFNPYTSQAPGPWQKHSIHSGFDGQRFTVFVQKYSEDERICKEWDFDKIKNMGGYMIPIATVQQPKNKHIGKGINSNAYQDVNNHIFDTMYQYLNVTPIVLAHPGPLYFGAFPHNTSGKLVFPMIVSNPYRLLGPGYAARSYPYSRSGLVIMTNFRGHKSQLEKILCVVDKNSRIGLCLVLLLTLLFFKFFVGQAIMPAFSNVVRIICDTGFTGLPSNTATRMYITALLFFAVTMQGIYQGNLASLLTHHVPVRNVETIDDLDELGYTVYSYALYNTFFEDRVFQSQSVPLLDTDCVEYVLNDSLAACVNYPHVLMDQAETLGLHLSLNYIIEFEEIFLLKRDCPLEDKFNLILQTMVEADIVRPLHLRVKQNTLSDFRFDEAVRNDKNVKVLTLDELAFAFVILGIGLFCALVAFVAEIAVFRYQTRNTIVRQF